MGLSRSTKTHIPPKNSAVSRKTRTKSSSTPKIWVSSLEPTNEVVNETTTPTVNPTTDEVTETVETDEVVEVSRRSRRPRRWTRWTTRRRLPSSSSKGSLQYGSYERRSFPNSWRKEVSSTPTSYLLQVDLI